MMSAMEATARQASPPSGQDFLSEHASIVAKGKEATMDAMEDIVFGSVSTCAFLHSHTIYHFRWSTDEIKIAGTAGKFIEYPFDTVKVRLQSQPDHLPLQYRGPIDCFRQSFRADGFAGLYRGISAPLIGAALETSSLFFWERLAQGALFKTGIYKSDEKLPLSALFLTGAISGAFTSLVLTPVELVKCKMQVPVIATPAGTIHTSTNPFSIIRQVFRHQGLRGFWHGQMGTLIRETGGCAAWFGSKETATKLFRNYNASSSPVIYKEADPLPLWQQAVAGATAGMSYNFLFFPADTIKSRMQTSVVEAGGTKQTFYSEGMKLWKQAGLKGLYRGCGITVLRSAPSSAFIFIIYDGLKQRIHFG
jgi:ornithine carrier protein